MIRLKSPLNYRGILLEKGTVVGFLPADLQERLVQSGAAERVSPETTREEPAKEKPIEKMTKSELLELAAKMGIQGVSDEMIKAEILEVITDAQQGGQENPGEDDSNEPQRSDSN